MKDQIEVSLALWYFVFLGLIVVGFQMHTNGIVTWYTTVAKWVMVALFAAFAVGLVYFLLLYPIYFLTGH